MNLLHYCTNFRHDKADEVPSADSLNDLDQIEEVNEEEALDDESDYEPPIMTRQSSIRVKDPNPKTLNILNEICDFVLEENPNLNQIKTVLNRQVERAQMRQKSLRSMLELLKLSQNLIPSVKYYLLSGWQGMVQHDQALVQTAPQVLDHVHLIPPQSQSQLLLSKAEVLEWTASELTETVKKAEIQIRIPKGARMKESLNHRDLHGLATLTSSRFLTSLLAMLTSHINGKEVGLLLGSQLLSSLQTLLRIIGPEIGFFGLGGQRQVANKSANICAIFEDTLQRCKSQPPPLSGPELARIMRVGTRVVRGIDWKWGDQDGPSPSEGNV